MFVRPVSEVYANPPNQIKDVEPDEHYGDWGYTVAYELDENGNNVPSWGNTAIFRILEGGMTEPVYVTKPDSSATFDISVLAGQGVLIRALATGAVEPPIELKEGDKVTIKPGQTYSYVNTGKKDFLLHDVARPAFRPGDDVEVLQAFGREQTIGTRLTESSALLAYERPDGSIYRRALPNKFFDLIGEAMAGRMKTEV